MFFTPVSFKAPAAAAFAATLTLHAALLPTPAGATEPSADAAAEVEHLARQMVLDNARQAGLAEPTLTLQLADSGRATPACPGPFLVEAVDTRHIGRMRFAAQCPDTGARTEFVVRARLSAQVVVVDNGLPAGQPIAAHDVSLARRTLDNAAEATSTLDEVVGQASRRPLRAGQVIDTRALIQPVLVRRNAAVRIVARNGPILVTAAGEALASGRLGDVIEVRNSTNGTVIRARVTARNEVAPADLSMAPAHLPR